MGEHIGIRVGSLVGWGCPASSVFVAIVLKSILSHVLTDMGKDAVSRVREGNFGNDGFGGIPIVMPHVDDINALVPLDQVNWFLDLFTKYGKRYGAILNK